MQARARRGRPPEHADRRASILDAALACFVERGFHGTAIPQIADKAGIAAGTIYHYFDSKEALVNALYRGWKTTVAQRVLAAFPQGAPVREQFRVMWNEMVGFATAEPTAFAFIELHNHASYLDEESVALDRNRPRRSDQAAGVAAFGAPPCAAAASAAARWRRSSTPRSAAARAISRSSPSRTSR